MIAGHLGVIYALGKGPVRVCRVPNTHFGARTSFHKVTTLAKGILPGTANNLMDLIYFSGCNTLACG
jgi:hypothetical protein